MIARGIRAVVRTLRGDVGSETIHQSRREREVTHETGSARTYKLALLTGFALFGLGVFAAHRAPADGYEVSVYWATPRLYWVGAGGALLVATATLLYDHERRFAPVSMLLGAASVASFLALPVIRGYYFHGYADPMTHLGRIRAIDAGFMNLLDPVYPGSYVFTLFVGSFGGLGLNRAMLYVTFVFGVAFLVFVPLSVRAIVPDRRAVVLGLFSAFLLLPINNVSLFFRFHPFSLTTLFFPLVAYLFVAHVTHAHDDGTLPWKVNASTVALPLATAALLFYHPQATADVLIIFAMVVGVQVLARIVAPDHPLAGYRAIYGQFLFLAVLFLVWASMHQGGAGRTIDALVDGLFGWISGEAETAQIVQDRTSSADSIDVSIYELFAKFFLVSAVYSLLAAGVVLAKFVGRLGRDLPGPSAPKSDTLVYFAFGGIGLVPFVVVHSFGRADDYLFRHVGFGMAIVTILGAVALYYLVTGLATKLGNVTVAVKPVFGVLATVVLVLSLLTVYSSPFLYLPGQHVSEQEMDGMKTAFEMQPEDRSVWFGGIRQNANRYEAAMFAAPNASWDGAPRARSSRPISDENVTRLRWYYENHPEEINQRDQYLMVSAQDYRTETVAYRGVRYSGENISAVHHQTGVHDVYTNGEARLYYVDTSGTPVVNGTVSDDAPDGDETDPSATGTGLDG